MKTKAITRQAGLENTILDEVATGLYSPTALSEKLVELGLASRGVAADAIQALLHDRRLIIRADRKLRVAKQATDKEAPSTACGMRRFVLERSEDVSGTSGTGTVAEGVQFSNGYVALTWLSHMLTLAHYHSVQVMLQIHGHQGRTTIRWIDA